MIDINDKVLDPVKVSGFVGKDSATNKDFITMEDTITKNLRKWKEERKLKLGIDDDNIKKQLIKDKVITENNADIFKFDVNKIEKDTKKFVGFDQVGIIKQGKLRVFNKKYDEFGREIHLETAEDNSALYDDPFLKQANWNTLYVINGKLISGWSMYFSAQCIRSPEDYAKNIDCIYNVPYLFASMDLKAQLGLGANFKVTDDNTNIDEAERFADWYLKKKLKMSMNFRKKVAMHKYSYGNAYIHIKHDENGTPTKLTILQPERVKIFLDQLTQKILFYVYLPPIIGAVALVPYYGAAQRGYDTSLMNAPALRFPSPVIIPVRDMIHWKVNDYTEYPFGFSEMKPGIDVAQARFDVNLLAPYYFKKYCKPMIIAGYGGETTNEGKIQKKMNNMKNALQGLEPGSDLIHGPGWAITQMSPASGQSEIFNLTADLDTQMFSLTRVPETYFKPKGSTDRMISESDKIFMASLRQEQIDFAEIMFERILKPVLNHYYGPEYFKNKGTGDSQIGEDVPKVETANFITQEDIKMDIRFSEFEDEYNEEINYPKIVFDELTKKDETQEIANTLSLFNAGIIDLQRASKRVGEVPPEIDPRTGLPTSEGNPQENNMDDLKGSKDMTRPQKNEHAPLNPEGRQKQTANLVPHNRQDIGVAKSANETADTLVFGGKEYKVWRS